MLRHGAPAFPDGRSYIYGHSDYPLSEAGEEQAREVAAELAEVGFERIISSDLARAVRTAEIVADAQLVRMCDVERDSGLREIFMGDWDGVPKDDLESLDRDTFLARGKDIASVSAPGGETFMELKERASEALGRIIESSAGLSRILIVAHGGVFWTIISRLFGLELGDAFRFCQGYCALHLVEYEERDGSGRFRLVFYNRRPMLSCYAEDAI
jgi:broad specificity phosphatase PhoE